MHKTVSWDEYKKEISDLTKNNLNFIFRGHEDSKWLLETSFTRENKNRLVSQKYSYENYFNVVIEIAHQYLGLIVNQDLITNKFEVLNFISILQQHGFPTPLLDWTKSPYIAAYFAFKDIRDSSKSDHVKIFAFDHSSWLNTYKQEFEISSSKPHLSVFFPFSKYNQRLIQQQGIHTISTVDDIDLYVQSCEQAKNKKFLHTFQISVKERALAIKDLHLMGISEMSLFPGIDGTCGYLKQRFFLADLVPFTPTDIELMLKALEELKAKPNQILQS